MMPMGTKKLNNYYLSHGQLEANFLHLKNTSVAAC